MSDMAKRIAGNLFSVLIGGLTVGVAIYLWRHDAENAGGIVVVWAMAVIVRGFIFASEAA